MLVVLYKTMIDVFAYDEISKGGSKRRASGMQQVDAAGIDCGHLVASKQSTDVVQNSFHSSSFES
jgi:hypothetical protein